MTQPRSKEARSAGAFRSGQHLGADVLPDRDAELVGCRLDAGQLVVGESDVDGVAARVLDGGPAGSWAHGTRIADTESLDQGGFSGYSKSMTTTSEISCIEPTCTREAARPEWGSGEQAAMIGQGWSFGVDGRIACPAHSFMKVAVAQTGRHVSTVADLTEAHVGWQIEVGRDRAASDFNRGRTYTLKGIRVWTYEGLTTVGLVDPSDASSNIIGTERHYDTTVEVKLIKPMTAKAKRLAKAAS